MIDTTIILVVTIVVLLLASFGITTWYWKKRSFQEAATLRNKRNEIEVMPAHNMKSNWRHELSLPISFAIAILLCIWGGSKFKILDVAQSEKEKFSKGSPIAHNSLTREIIESIKESWDVYFDLMVRNNNEDKNNILKLWNSMINRKISLYKIDMATEPQIVEDDFNLIKWTSNNWIEHGSALYEDIYLIQKKNTFSDKFSIWLDYGLTKIDINNIHNIVKIHVKKPGTQGLGTQMSEDNLTVIPLGVKNVNYVSFLMIELKLNKDDFDETGRTIVTTYFNSKYEKGIDCAYIPDFSLSSPYVQRYNEIEEINFNFYFKNELLLFKSGYFSNSSFDVKWESEKYPVNKSVRNRIPWGRNGLKVEKLFVYQITAEKPILPPLFEFRQALNHKK